MSAVEAKMRARPRHRIANAIRDRIASGQFAAGQRIPTELSLAAEFKVSRGTVRQALRVLADQGALELRRGVGGFVRAAALEDGTLRRHAPHFLLAHPRGRMMLPEVLSGLETATHEHGGQLGIIGISEDMEENRAALAARVRGLAGIVFTPFVQPGAYQVNSQVLDLFDQLRLHYVCIGTPVAASGVIRGDFVGNDGYSAMREVARHCAELGHTRIGSIRVFPDVYTSDHRYMGVVDELRTLGLPHHEAWHRTIEDVPLPGQGRRRIREIMALPERPTVILCNHDIIAINVFDELRAMGMRVPDDISLFGFDDTLYASLLRISSVRQPLPAIGRRAVQLLLDPSQAKRQEFLPCAIMRRTSVKNLVATPPDGKEPDHETVPAP